MKIVGTFLVAVGLCVGVVACKNKSKFNGDHLTPKEMQKVLLDVNLAESYSTTVKDSLHKGGSKNMDSLAVYYKDIFNHYGITKEQFEESLDWYKEHPEELDTMYNNMLPIITKWQNAVPVRNDKISPAALLK